MGEQGMKIWGMPLYSQSRCLLLGLGVSRKRVEFSEKKTPLNVILYADRPQGREYSCSLPWHAVMSWGHHEGEESLKCTLVSKLGLPSYSDFHISNVSLISSRPSALGKFLFILSIGSYFSWRKIFRLFHPPGKPWEQNKDHIPVNLPSSGGQRWCTSEWVICYMVGMGCGGKAKHRVVGRWWWCLSALRGIRH